MSNNSATQAMPNSRTNGQQVADMGYRQARNLILALFVICVGPCLGLLTLPTSPSERPADAELDARNWNIVRKGFSLAPLPKDGRIMKTGFDHFINGDRVIDLVLAFESRESLNDFVRDSAAIANADPTDHYTDEHQLISVYPEEYQRERDLLSEREENHRLFIRHFQQLWFSPSIRDGVEYRLSLHGKKRSMYLDVMLDFEKALIYMYFREM